MRLGYVGTGNMGARFVERLLKAGHQVAVYDTRAEALVPMSELGAEVGKGPAAIAADTEAVFVSLPTPAIVESVATEVIAALPAGHVFVDMSTSPPELARKIAAACEAKGAFGLDAPVSNGGVFVTVGGPREVFERFRAAFEAMCERVLYVGPAGQGQIAKLTRQYVSFTGFFTLVEALLVAAKAGGDVRAVADFIGESTGYRGPGGSLARLFSGDFGDPATSRARLDIVAKDLALAVALADDVAAPSGTGTVAADILRRGQELGWGDFEYWVAVCALEQQAGVELRPG